MHIYGLVVICIASLIYYSPARPSLASAVRLGTLPSKIGRWLKVIRLYHLMTPWLGQSSTYGQTGKGQPDALGL
jgi:hypothetical protein